MKKTAITALIMGVISISVLQAQSDFGPKKHQKNISIHENENSKSNTSLLSYSIPFTEEFENGIPPTDWTSFIGTNGAGNTYNWTQNWGYSGLAAFVDWDDAGGIVCEDWLVTPLITLGENTSMTFYEKQSYSTNYGSNYYIKISTNSQTNHGDFTDIIAYTESDFSTSWGSRTIDLSAYDGQDVYIAFVMTNDDGDSWYIDNIEIIDDPGGGGTPGGDLLISEIAYPTDNDGINGRFIELFNSGDANIDLSPYYIAFYKNQQRINLSGTINAGETFIYAPDNANFNSCYGFNPDDADGGINASWFDGTDAIILLEKVGGSYRTRDIFGVKKTNGDGTDWDYEGMHAVRNPEITSNSNSYNADEWQISTAYYSYRDVTPGNHNNTYYWTGNYNDEWDDYRNWTVNTGYQTIPDAGSKVVIPAGASNNASLGLYNFPYFFHSLTIQSGASFTMKSFNILRVVNDVTIESNANLLLESDVDGAAAFIVEGNVSGIIDIERWFPSIGGTTTNGEWHYFSPPISDLSSNTFLDQYLMYWDEPTTYWQYITATDYTLIPGLGYGVLLQNEFGNTIDMNGSLVTADVQSPNLTSTNGAGWEGWNLIGNPYTASLDWEKVVDMLPSNVDVGIHYWDGANDQYLYYNNGNGTATQYIPPMQGFFIHTNQNNTQFTIPANARTYQGQDVYYKSGDGKPYQTKTYIPREHNNRLIISSLSESGKTDKAYLEFHPKASEEFDFEFDSRKFDSNNDSIPEPYILYNSDKYAINTLPIESMDGRYDLCVNFGINDTYVLSFDDIDSFDESQAILLFDKFTGEYFDLKQENNIAFYNDSNAPEDRFEIVFDDYLKIPILSKSNWLVFSNNGRLNIRKKTNTDFNSNYTYQIISTAGNVVYEEQFNNEVINKALDISHNIYLIRVFDGKSQSSYKVLLHP